MLTRLPKTARRRTVAGDKGYDTRGFVADVRGLGFTPHVAQNTARQRSAVDGRTTRHAGHAVSMRIRKRIEEPFGWMKTIGGGGKLRYRGRQRNLALVPHHRRRLQPDPHHRPRRPPRLNTTAAARHPGTSPLAAGNPPGPTSTPKGRRALKARFSASG